MTNIIIVFVLEILRQGPFWFADSIDTHNRLLVLRFFLLNLVVGQLWTMGSYAFNGTKICSNRFVLVKVNEEMIIVCSPKMGTAKKISLFPY